MIPDPKLSRIFSLGLTHDKPPQPPKLSIMFNGIAVTVQPDGQIALFTEKGIFSCECRGHEINGLPTTANFKIGIIHHGEKIKIYQEDRCFYSKRGQTIRIFANYFPGSKSIPATVAHTPQEIGNDTDGDMCHIFHTDDWDLDDYQQQTEEEESPTPLNWPETTED
jgi:hypothetical protein